jgi:hypothetical protein
MAAVATGFRIGETNTWATKVPLPSRKDDETQSRTPMAIHFVIDNSQSMGNMTREVIIAFSSLVDSAATKPCSLTLFGSNATLVSASIKTTQQMLDLPDLNQGMTNIPAGVEKAIDLIIRREQEKKYKGMQDRTHHILVLLTDGIHNSGPEPSIEFPKIGKVCMAAIPEVQISVVLVGITRNSSTSMGMLLKTSLETVPLDSAIVKNIYFASTQSQVKNTAAKLVEGLDRISTARVHTVSHPDAIFISDIGIELASTVTFRANDSTKTILIESKQHPDYLVVDETKVDFAIAEIVDNELIADALLEHIDRIKIQRVASAKPERVRAAIERLHVLISGLATQLEHFQGEAGGLKLNGMRGSDRLAQHRQLFRTMQMARELRNELKEVANFEANNSEEQAAFLTGGKSKFASKAFKRAAARSAHGEVLDPIKELKKVFQEVSSKSFSEDLTSCLRADVLTHLARLSQAQITVLERYVEGVSSKDAKTLRQLILEVRYSVLGEVSSCHMIREVRSNVLPDDDRDPGVARAMKELVDSGSLAGYLNEVFFGRRQSYLSLASPWEHISEWRDFLETETALHSQWEMLMYLGFVACPIAVERNAAAQMDPFQLTVKKIRTTLVDTASLCCANHSEIDTFGPEGGEPIKDALVLVDPSCPRASAKILSTSLLGESYSSVVVSRDLHMYSGSSMKIALLANSLYRCLMPESTRKGKSDIIAELRRQFLGKAYQCPKCGFGPVDHGGCASLFTHHGERQGRGTVSNACPSCGWFSSKLNDWKRWDGTVPDSLMSVKERKERRELDQSQKTLYSKMDMVLRILYSFRKQFAGLDNAIKQQYHQYAQKLVDWDLTFTTTDGIQS